MPQLLGTGFSRAQRSYPQHHYADVQHAGAAFHHAAAQTVISERPTITRKATNSGKIIIVDLPVQTYRPAGRNLLLNVIGGAKHQKHVSTDPKHFLAVYSEARAYRGPMVGMDVDGINVASRQLGLIGL
jgi:hypothetical protein